MIQANKSVLPEVIEAPESAPVKVTTPPTLVRKPPLAMFNTTPVPRLPRVSVIAPVVRKELIVFDAAIVRDVASFTFCTADAAVISPL